MNTYKFGAAAFAAAFMLTQPVAASAASIIYNLNVADPAAGLGSGPFGTVTVTEVAGGGLSFLETLADGVRIHDGNANHNALSFSILGDPALTISSLTAGFTAVSPTAGTNVDAPPFGSFFTAIDCTTACSNGFAGGFPGPLSFTVTAANPLSLASLGFNSVGGNNIYFTSDLVISNGNTGNVGATRPAAPVPEPATWAMMFVGFGMVGFGLRRRGRVERRVNFAF